MAGARDPCRENVCTASAGRSAAAGAAWRRPHACRCEIDRDYTSPLATLARLHQEAAATIEHLIAFIDDTDGIADDEAEEDADVSDVGEGDMADDERRQQLQEHKADLESSLAGVTADDGFTDHCDLEDDDHDDDVEREPDLGWTTDRSISDTRHLEMNGEFT